MPSVQDTQEILDIISQNPSDARSQQAQQKLGLSNTAIDAWRVARETPDDPRAVQVKNKIFDQIAQNLPANQAGGGGASFVDRFVVKNLIDRDPDLQDKYLRKKGYQTRFTEDGKGLEVKLPGEAEFKPVDPEGFDRFDLFDVIGDALEGVVTGVATGAKALGLVGAPVTGGASLAATSALGGASTAGFEAAKQTVAKAIGAREEYDPSRIAQAGLIGATIPVVFKAGGYVLRKTGEGFNYVAKKVFPKKINADEIEAAVEALGSKATPGQVSASPAVQRAEEQLANKKFLLPGIGRGVRKRVQDVQKAVDDSSKSLVENNATRASLELGESAKKKIIDTVNERLKPAEDIYQRLEGVYNYLDEKELVKIDTTKLKESVNALIDNTFDDATESALKKAAGKIDRLSSLNDVTKLRSNILKSARNTINPEQKQALNELAQGLNQLRSDTLKKQFPEALDAIQQADRIWAEVAQDIQQIFFKPGQQLKGSVKGSIKSKLESIPGEQAVRKLFQSGNFRQIEKFKEKFPDAFEQLRQGAVDDIISRSLTQDSKLSVGSLVKKLRLLPEESQNLIFGPEKKKIIEALNLVMQETQATVRNNPSRLRDILVSVSNNTSLGKLTVGQLHNAFLTAVVHGPGTLNALSKGAQATGRFLGSPAGVAAGEFGARSILPPQESKFNIPQRNPVFAVPSQNRG